MIDDFVQFKILLPKNLKGLLETRATVEKRSLSQQIIYILDRELNPNDIAARVRREIGFAAIADSLISHKIIPNNKIGMLYVQKMKISAIKNTIDILMDELDAECDLMMGDAKK